jgi:hypothetical protein
LHDASLRPRSLWRRLDRIKPARQHARQIWGDNNMKNFLAVIAGLAFVIVVSMGLDAVMHGTGVFSMDNTAMTTGNWLLALSYRLLAAIGGGWITARLAQSRPKFFAIVLGIIGTIVGLAGLAAAWMMRPNLGPLWYPILLVVTAIPCTWLGAKWVKPRHG